MFKVVPDQLRISDGWVRCGRCDEVFDAHQHLVTGRAEVDDHGPETTPVAVDAGSPLAEALHATTRSLDVPPQDVGGAGSAPATSSESLYSSEYGTPVATEDRWNKLLAHSPGAEPSPSSSTSASAYRFSDAMEPHLTSSSLETSVDIPTARLQSDGTAEHALPTFMRNKGLHTRTTRMGKVLWGLAAIFLSFTLLLQITVHERDRWAAYEPAMRPAIQSLCAWLGCQVRPLRSIEALAIDHSSFIKMREGVFRLNVVLKNNALFAVAAPSLELALTDMQDQPIVRRVLLASDIVNHPTELMPSSEISVSLAISIQGESVVRRVSGYRVLAFYP